jgi:hypothetical protein
MPTVLFSMGWRFFFYANEGNEPIHVHCQKAEKEAKFWLDRENYEAIEDFSYRMSPADIRTVKKLIYVHFEDLEREWDEFERRRRG